MAAILFRPQCVKGINLDLKDSPAFQTKNIMKIRSYL